MSEYDFLLSEKPQLEIQPYSKWAEGKTILDEVDGRVEYADYLRSTYLDNGIVDESTEMEIRNGLKESLLSRGVSEDEANQLTIRTPQVSFDEKLRDVQNTLPYDSPEWEAVTQYTEYKKTLDSNPDATDEFKAKEVEYRTAAEEALTRSYDDVLRSKIRNNEIPFAKVLNDDGNYEIIASDLAAQLPLKDALAQSQKAGVGLADAYVAKRELDTEEGFTAPNYKVKRIAEAASMLEALAKEDEDVKANIDGYARKMARTEYDWGDSVGAAFNRAGEVVVNAIGTMLGRGDEIKAKEDFKKKAELTASTNLSTTAERLAKKINTSGAIRESEAYSVDEIKTAMNELGVRRATDQGYFQFHDGDDEIGKNIRNYGYGLPTVPPALMANKEKFDKALAARPDISDKVKSQLEGQRKQFIDKQFHQFNDLLTRSDIGEDWQNELQKGRASGQKDSKTLETFLANEDNYSEISQRFKGLTMSVVDGFGQLVAAIPAAVGSEFAQDYLADVAQKNQDRRELANMFGVDLGTSQDVAESLAPMLTDMGATALLGMATAPAGGVGGAGYLAAKQGARLTVKGVAKGLVSNVFRPLAGETTEQAAQRVLADGLIKQSVADGGINGAMAAIKGASGQIASRLVNIPASFIPAANRSMGATYGTLFNQLQKDPNLTREEAHDRALGAAITSGVVTGVITSGFSAIGRGGLETALTRGLTFREMKTVLGRLTNAAEDLSNKQTTELIKNVLGESLKKNGYLSLGKHISREAYNEGVEEGLDQFVNGFVQDAALNENTPMIERLNQSFNAFVVGGIIGAGVPTVQRIAGTLDRDARTAAARDLEYQAFTDISNKLTESGSPMTAEIVRTMLTGPVRRRQQIESAIERRRAAAATPAVEATVAPVAEAPAAEAPVAPVTISAQEASELTQMMDSLKDSNVAIPEELYQKIQSAQATAGAATQAEASAVEAAVTGTPTAEAPVAEAPATTVTPQEAVELTKMMDTLKGSNVAIPEELYQKVQSAQTITSAATQAEAPAVEAAITGTSAVEATATGIDESPETLLKSLSDVTEEDVMKAVMAIRPQEIDSTEQFDIGFSATQEEAGKSNSVTVPFHMLDFKETKPAIEKVGLSFDEYLRSEVSDLSSKPTVIPRAELPSAPNNKLMVEATADQFAGDQEMKEAESTAFNVVASTGFPILFRSNSRYGMPPRDISEKATGEKSYYSKRSDLLADTIYQNFPVVDEGIPEGGSAYKSAREITYYDPIAKQRVTRKPITGALDANGRGVFNNNPVLIAEMIRDGIPVRVPRSFEGNINPSLVIRGGRVVDVLGPRPDGKAGMISMTAPIERQLTSEPDYKSLNEASNLASIFLDDKENQRVIPSGAPVVDQSGKVTNIGSMPTSVGEVLGNFNQLMVNATTPELVEGARVSGVTNTLRIAARNMVQKTLRLVGGRDLEAGFFDTALQALHVEYMNHVNMFEIRSSLISSKIAIETPTGWKIDPNKTKAAIKMFSARLRPENKTTIAERLSPFVTTSAEEIKKNPNAVMLKFLDGSVLNNKRFEGNTMPTIDQLASTVKVRYDDQQKAREIEEKVKATTSMDPTIMDQVELNDLTKEASYIGEPSLSDTPRMSSADISKMIKQSEFDALSAMDENPDLRDALNDLLFQSVYVDPTPTQVTRVTNMTTVDAFGTLANWIAKGNYNHPEIIKFERTLRDGGFESGNDLRRSLNFLRLSSRGSEFSDPTQDTEYVSSVQAMLANSLGGKATTEQAKNFIRAIDKSMRKRMSRSHITEAQKAAARQFNTVDAARLGLESGDPESVIKALEQIAKTSKNQSHKLVANLLLEDKAFIKTIKFEIGEADIGVAGEYNRLIDGSHSVFINLNGHNGRGLQNVLLEEYVHAFLSDTVNKPKDALTTSQAEAVTRLNGLMELVRKQAEKAGITDPSLTDGLVNIDEFIANFLLSQKFQALVKDVDPPKGQRGFFSRIIDAIVSLFRKVNKKENALYSNALKDIIEISRSAINSERNTSASLFATVAEDASDIMNRAADTYDALPESVKATRGVVEEVVETTEAIFTPSQEVVDAANAELIAEQRKLDETNVPKSVSATDTEQLAKARNLQALIRSIVPFEVRVKYLNKDEVLALGEERRFVASATGNLVEIDMGRMMAFVDGLDGLTSNMVVESIIYEELGHVASYNALPQSVIDEIANSFNQNELDSVADSYYQNDTDRTAAKERLRSEDEGTALSEKRRLTEEHLRAHLQRVTTGSTSEETAAFVRTNPSLFKIMLRYIGGVFRRMVGLRKTGNPLVDAALNRMLTEMRALKMGYRTRPSVLRFDPNNPTASLEAFRAITGIDNLDEIEAAGFDEDGAETLYSQINLEDFKRIQYLSRPDVIPAPAGMEVTPEKIEKLNINIGDFMDFVGERVISRIADEAPQEYESEFEFTIDSDGMINLNLSDNARYNKYDFGLLSGPIDAEGDVRFKAAVAYLKNRFENLVKDFSKENNIPVEYQDGLAQALAEGMIIDVEDLGMGYELITNTNAYDEYAGTIITVSPTYPKGEKTNKLNLNKIKESILQLDGYSIIREDINPDYTDFIVGISRGSRNYSLMLSAKRDGSIYVGSLVPKETVDSEGKQISGEAATADSLGLELLLALIPNNHLIGATSLSTSAAGSATEVDETSERNTALKKEAKEKGIAYVAEVAYKGYKTWAKIGFDALLSNHEIQMMAEKLVSDGRATGSVNEVADEIRALAEDEDGIPSIVQLTHLGPNPDKGELYWSKSGSSKNMTFDLTAGSPSMRAFGAMIERMVKVKGLVEEIKPARQAYARSMKAIERSKLDGEERLLKEQEIKNTLVQELNKYGVNPDRLLTSLGSGTAFSGSSIQFDSFIEMLEAPIFEAGTYKSPTKGFMRAIIGELDPRIKRFDDNRKFFGKSVANLVTRYKATLDKLVEKRYGSIANAPNELIGEAMGSTGVEVDEAVYDGIEDAHTERLIAIRNNSALTADQRSAEVVESARLRDEAISAARKTARELAVKRKDAALTKLTEQAPEIAKHIVDIRQKLIDPLSLKLKDSYGLTEEFGVYIDSQLGIYMTRAYRMFNEIGFADRVKTDPLYEKAREKAMEFFDNQFVKNERRRLEREGVLPAEAERLAKEALLNKRSSNGMSYGQQALNAFIESYATKNEAGLGGAALGEGYRVILNNLKQKKEIPSELREILGEYKNSEEGTNNLLRTFVTVATMANNQSFLNNVRSLGEKNGFLVTSEEYHNNPSKYEGFVPFRSTKTSMYDPLLGMYAPKEMVEGFQKTFDSNTMRRNTSDAIDIVDKSMTIINKATGYAMAAKTLGSVGFYLRNSISNMLFFGPSQGFGRIDKMLKVAAKQSWAGLKDQNRIDSYIADLTALGIVGDDIQTGIIKDLLNGKVDSAGLMKQIEGLLDKTQLSKGKQALEFIADKASRLSAHTDAVYKIAYFEHELNKLKEAQRFSNTGSVAGLSEYQLKRLAAEKVLMTAQSASQAAPIVTQLSKSGLGLQFAPFLRFKAEIPRIIINTYKLARTEMKDANPKIKQRGQIRFASMTGMLAFSTALPAALRVLVAGIGDDEDEALRASIPEYLRGNTFYYFGKGDSLSSINLTFVNPWSMYADPTMRALEQISRGNFGEAASQFVQGMIFDQYLDDQIFAGAFFDVKNNKDSTTGEPIWEKDIDNVGSIISKQLLYLAEKAYSPRILSDSIKAYQASGGDYTEFDDSPLGIMMSGVYPARFHDIDLNKQFNRYLREKKEQFDRITKRKYTLYGERPISEDNIRELYDSEVRDRKTLNQDLVKIIRGFEGLGMTRQDVYKDMTTRGGISKRRAALLFNNMMDRPDINKGFLQGLLEKEYGMERAQTIVDQMGNYSRYMFVEE
jgi:hypothetical protein